MTYPCQIATAPDGALYVAEDPMDQVGPYEAYNGRILLFRDGKDPVVFADGFRAVFGMAWHDGQLYVSHMPFLTVLRDTDGDGKADERKDLFKDLGPTNNQGLNDHIVSGLQFGMDGYLYISIGDKGVYKATGPDGRTVQLIGGGTMRCRPDGTGIEVISTGTRNHLETNLDDRDNLFTYDNTDDGLGWWTRVTHHVDGGYYGYAYDYHARKDRMLDRMAEYGGGSPCGGILYKEDVWPEKYRNVGFWAEWGKRHVAAIKFEPAGASFEVAEYIKFMEKDDGVENFRPIDLAVSYDGKTLYIADWSMGSWGSKTEKVGRVFAITYEGKVETKPRGKDSDPIDVQIKALSHPSFNERMRAQARGSSRRWAEAASGPVARALYRPQDRPVSPRGTSSGSRRPDRRRTKSPSSTPLSRCPDIADGRRPRPGGPGARGPVVPAIGRAAGDPARRRMIPTRRSVSRAIIAAGPDQADPGRSRRSCRSSPTPIPISPSRRGSRCGGSATGRPRPRPWRSRPTRRSGLGIAGRDGDAVFDLGAIAALKADGHRPGRPAD